jgi:hypothetical protein
MGSFQNTPIVSFGLVIGNNRIDNFIHSKILELVFQPETLVIKTSMEAGIEFLMLGKKLGREPDLILLDMDFFKPTLKNNSIWVSFTEYACSKKVILVNGKDIQFEISAFKLLRHIEKPVTFTKMLLLSW